MNDTDDAFGGAVGTTELNGKVEPAVSSCQSRFMEGWETRGKPGEVGSWSGKRCSEDVRRDKSGGCSFPRRSLSPGHQSLFIGGERGICFTRSGPG